MTAFRPLPGWLTNTTGVPNKRYRGAQQVLPGWLTNTTGVPSKFYRGPQQIGFEKHLQLCIFFAFTGVPLYC